MTDKSVKSLLIISVILSTVAIIVSSIVLGWTVFRELSDAGDIELIRNRLEDLETEHDYVLEKEVTPSSQGLVSLPSFCSLPPSPGPCGSVVPRWYYLPRQQDCIQFPWGGCKGNNNNFVSLEQCRAACQVSKGDVVTTTTTYHELPTIPTMREEFSPSDCNLPPDSGPCSDRITRYYHDGGDCMSFQYGGCSGNNNNFFSWSECERYCGGQKQQQGAGARKRHRKDSCSLAEDRGTCGGSETRFRWDKEEGECVMFVWSGCGGNSNNFRTRSKCRKRCAGEPSV